MIKKVFAKKNIPLILFILAVIGIMIYAYVMQEQKKQQLQLLLNQRASMQDEMDVKSAAIQKTEQGIVHSVSGLDYERVARDKSLMSGILEEVLTWDTYEKYNGARNHLIQTYKVKSDDRLLTEFMPKVDEDHFTVNAKFEEISDNHVTAIVGSDYRYFSVVKLSSKGKKGGSATGEIAFTYKMDKDGKVSDISAFVVNP